jgi:hypothetical protein
MAGSPRLHPETDFPVPAHSQFYRWTPPQCILFRFVFAYLILYAAPATNRADLLSVIPGGAFVARHYISVWHSLVPWIAKSFFHLSGRAIVYVRTGSTDTTLDYIQEFCFVLLALAATVLWSILDRRWGNYSHLHAWLRLLIRYTLSFALLNYAFVKIFPLQFRSTPLDRFIEPYGNFSPMGVLWSFMGASTPYTIFGGVCEATAATFLLFRSTTTLGGLIGSGVLLNIVMLNFCYDVPVKLYSANLLLMAVFLVTPDVRRVVNIFVLNRPADPSSVPSIRFERRAVRIAVTAFQLAFTAIFLFRQVSSDWKQYERTYVNPEQPAIYGLYRVEAFLRGGQEVPPLATDQSRWNWLIAEYPRGLAIQKMDGLPQLFPAQYDTLNHHVALTVRGVEYTLSYSYPDPDHLLFEGKLEGDAISVRSRKIEPSAFLLASRGFHWINELPFNR